VKLYTDSIPGEAYKAPPDLSAREAEAEANRDFQNDVFKDIKLPMYVVFVPQPDGKVLLAGAYEEGKINDPARFVAFLKDAQEKGRLRK
jgi:hypothetical protein